MSSIQHGFRDAVHDSQQVFRTVLEAMSRPGKIQTLDAQLGFGQAPAAATQTLLALADHSTPLWLGEQAEADTTLTENLKFHTGVPVVDLPQVAAFALCSAAEAAPLNRFCQGEEAYPETSTTVLIEVVSLTEGEAFELSGPGVQGREEVRIAGLSAALKAELVQRGSAQILGTDLLLVCGEQLLALPRSTRIKMLEE